MNSNFLNFVAFIPSRCPFLMQANILGVYFLGSALKFREWEKIRGRLFTSSIKSEMSHYPSWSCSDGKEMYKKAWCTCNNVVFLIKPIAFLPFSLPGCRRCLRFLMLPGERFSATIRDHHLTMLIKKEGKRYGGWKKKFVIWWDWLEQCSLASLLVQIVSEI